MEWPQSASTTGSPANQFLQLWRQADQTPDVFDFLNSRPLSPMEQFEVVRVDQNCRWESGNAIPVERYLSRLPLLEQDVSRRFELVYAELKLFRDRWLSSHFDPPLQTVQPSTVQPTAVQPSETGVEVEDFRSTGQFIIDPDRNTEAAEAFEPAETKVHSRSYFREVLPRCGPFSRLPSLVTDLLASYLRRVSFPPGCILMQQGDQGDHLLVLVQGSVEISVRTEQVNLQVIDSDQAPSILGEMALLTRERRRANVVATSRVEAGILSADEFHRLRNDHPILGEVLTSLLADRIGNKTHDALGGEPLCGFRFHERVGVGGTGVVYRATRLETGEVFALKMLSHRQVHDREAVERFQQEAAILRELQHRNIARIHDWFPAFETYFLVMDFCDGVTLSRLLRMNGPLPADQIRLILGGVAAGLHAAHQASIVHRDLKPSNVMIARDGSVLLMDFGLATKGPSVNAVGDDLIMGTPRYMAPEQHQTSQVDEQCDLYAFGCLLYELLTGLPLFPQRNRWTIFTAKIEYRLPDISEFRIPRDLYEILAATLHYKPTDRHLNLAQVAAWAGKADPRLVTEAMEKAEE